MAWGMAVDGAIVLLLVATIVYCVVLHRRLRRFAQAGEEIRSAIAGFATATVRAEASTAGLRKAANEAGSDLARQIEAARAAAEELRFLAKSASELSTAAEGRAKRSRPKPRPADLADDDAWTEQGARSEAERELLQAMRQVR